MKPPTGGLIVRTVAEGLTKKQLKQDVGYLVRLWGEVAKKREGAQRAARCLYERARPRAQDGARSLHRRRREDRHRRQASSTTASAASSRCSCPSALKDDRALRRATSRSSTRTASRTRSRARSRARCRSRRGGYLIIDQAEALTAIDVNTGRFVGKGSKDLEETILKTNLEAVEEIAYQLRFRNIGGLIILDLIDMEQRAEPREGAARRSRSSSQKDKAKTTLNRISRARPHRDDAQAHAREPRAHCCTSRASTATAPGSCSRRRRSPTRSCAQIRRERHEPAGLHRSSSTRTRRWSTCSTSGEKARRARRPSSRFMRRIELVPAQGVPPRAVRPAGQVSAMPEERRDERVATSAADERVTINKEFESFDAFIQEYVTNISRTGVFVKSQTPLADRHAGEPALHRHHGRHRDHRGRRRGRARRERPAGHGRRLPRALRLLEGPHREAPDEPGPQAAVRSAAPEGRRCSPAWSRRPASLRRRAGRPVARAFVETVARARSRSASRSA